MRMRTRIAAICATAIVATLAAQLTADAAVFNPFAARYQDNVNGSIVIIGNTNLTCRTVTAGCTAALAGGSTNNNSFYMVNSDADTDTATSLNSSSSNLAIPTGAVVKFAGLYWGARTTAGGSLEGLAGTAAPAGSKQIDLKVPGGTYTTLTASPANFYTESAGGTGAYQGFVNITSLVASAGNGTYWGGDIKAGLGADRYAGWSLVVAYELPSEPLSNLTVFDGFAGVSSSAGNNNVTLNISGFLTPAVGTVSAQVGVVSYEGDRGTTGDQLRFDGDAMSDASNPLSNSFNASISNLGANVTTRSNPNPNTLGFDIDVLNANGMLSNSQTSTTVNLT